MKLQAPPLLKAKAGRGLSTAWHLEHIHTEANNGFFRMLFPENISQHEWYSDPPLANAVGSLLDEKEKEPPKSWQTIQAVN
jgi:hypothetical protein